jgi:hypothetical protein
MNCLCRRPDVDRVTKMNYAGVFSGRFQARLLIVDRSLNLFPRVSFKMGGSPTQHSVFNVVH